MGLITGKSQRRWRRQHAKETENGNDVCALARLSRGDVARTARKITGAEQVDNRPVTGAVLVK